MPERFRVVCTIKALYKCSDLPLPLPSINEVYDENDYVYFGGLDGRV